MIDVSNLVDLLTWKIPAFAFALGLIIVVHEAGHLAVAKAFAVRVLTFSVGFGKRLWGFKRGGTDYRVSIVPLGGYVRLSGENPEDEHSDDPREFLNKPRWQRVLVYLAGPAMNVVLSILLFAGLFMVGIHVNGALDLPDIPPVVGGVAEGSEGARAGVRKGDRILEANGKPVASFNDVFFALVEPGRPAHFKVERNGRTFDAKVTPGRIQGEDLPDLAGIYPMSRPEITTIKVESPADRAGFRPNDKIIEVNGRPVLDGKDFVDSIEKLAGQRALVGIERDGRPMVLTVTPLEEGGVGRIGVGLGSFRRYPPLRALKESVKHNVRSVQTPVLILSKVLTGELSADSTLSGPVKIFQETARAAEQGFDTLLYLIGFLSISIAFVNLLPIPLLDGGQIVILLVESVIRRDLSLKVKEYVGYVGLAVIVTLMVMVFYFDIF